MYEPYENYECARERDGRAQQRTINNGPACLSEYIAENTARGLSHARSRDISMHEVSYGSSEILSS